MRWCRLRGSIREQHTLANRMSQQLWDLLTTKDYVSALGAISGGQATQMVKAGLRGHLPVGVAGGR